MTTWTVAFIAELDRTDSMNFRHKHDKHNSFENYSARSVNVGKVSWRTLNSFCANVCDMWIDLSSSPPPPHCARSFSSSSDVRHGLNNNEFVHPVLISQRNLRHPKSIDPSKGEESQETTGSLVSSGRLRNGGEDSWVRWYRYYLHLQKNHHDGSLSSAATLSASLVYL
jgi:hypothetical protein